MDFAYKSYGVSDILGKDCSILGEEVGALEPKEKFLNNILKKASTANVVALSNQDKKDLLTAKMLPTDKILNEGLFSKPKTYHMYVMKDYTVNKKEIEMLTWLDYDTSESRLDSELAEIKRAFSLMEPRLFNALFIQQADYHMNAKNIDDLKKKAKLDQILYMPESERNTSYVRFAYNYDNIHGQINQKFFDGYAVFINIWIKNGRFYSYRFNMNRTYRSDEFTN